jgi:lysM domain-containing protein
MTEIPMRPLLHLTVVALAGALGAVALAASAWSAGTALASVPVAWWSTSQIAQIAIVLACGIGAAGCLWHLASAGLALAILLQDAVAITSQASQASTTTTTSRGASARTVMGGRADVVLQRWGAPLVRRITTGALIAGIAISPAATAAPSASAPPDDLGWRVSTGAAAAPPDKSAPDPDGAESAQDSPPAEPAPPAVESAENADPAASSGSAPDDGTGTRTDSAHTHTVEPGESLWSITAAALGPDATDAQIVQTWPLVYETNTEPIGSDPSLLRPGAELRLPDALAQARPTPSEDRKQP